MAKLSDILLAGDNRPRVVADCVQLIDAEVANKSGLSGMAVKGAYAVVKKLRPGIIKEAVERLLDDFVGELEPFFGEYGESGQSDFRAFLVQREAAVANGLLGVTDRRIDRADQAAIKKAYSKLRPTGEKHVRAAIPGVAGVVSRYL